MKTDFRDVIADNRRVVVDALCERGWVVIHLHRRERWLSSKRACQPPNPPDRCKTQLPALIYTRPCLRLNSCDTFHLISTQELGKD